MKLTKQEYLKRQEEIYHNWKSMKQRDADLADLYEEYCQGVEVGDGMTVTLYSDSHAYTIIKRTACTLTLQQDIATLNPEFKPKMIAGGFAGHCVNQNEQSYSYERNPNGRILKATWSKKSRCWKVKNHSHCTPGRDEFYDYNF